MIIDVVHHLENIDATLSEAFKVILPDGQVISHEPNKLNSIIALLHLRDRNEWGLLRCGTPLGVPPDLRKVHDTRSHRLEPRRDRPISSDLMNCRPLRPVLGWLNPKMIVTSRKRRE